jgi:hypothetical protein
MPTELTINDIVYYVIPGGRPTVDRHPYEVPLILYNQPLEKIMAFGDEKRTQGRKPCVIIPSPALGGSYADAWNNHADPSGLLDNIAAHIDCYIVDPASAKTPALPSVWQDTAPSPQYIFWERLNQELYFRGSHNQFIQTFGFDPEDEPPAAGPSPNSGTVPVSNLIIHMDCPHCGKRIY